jgi:DNA polymerase eta
VYFSSKNSPDTQELMALTTSPARKFGLTRHITATEARKLCPNVHLAHVQTWVEGDTEPQYHANPKVPTHKVPSKFALNSNQDQVSLDPYRRASLKILEIFRAHCDRVEKASIDESFIDLSSQIKQKLLERYPELMPSTPYNDTSYQLPVAPTITFPTELGAVVPLSEGESEEEGGDWDDVIMSIGAEMIRDIRREVEEKLGYSCSAGIARNKMLAKLAAGWKKPNQQVLASPFCA